MSKNFQPLSSGEVLSVSNESQIVIGHSTFRVSEFTAALKQLMLDNGVGGVTPETIDWLTAEGIDCDVLRFGSDGWVKGKVRLHLEFSEDADAEASPDPKTEAAIEFVAPVAAATPVIAESVTSPVDDEDLDFEDDELDFSEEIEASPSVSEMTISGKDTFVQEDDSSFDDLFETDELDESEDDGIDDLFEEESLDESEVVEPSAEDNIDAAMGEFDDLLSDDETEADELDPASTAPADEDELDDLFGDDSLFDEADNSEPDEAVAEEQAEEILAGLDTELEAIAEDTADEDDSIELNFGETEEEIEPSAELESLTDDNGDDLFSDTDDELFADIDDAAEESQDTTEEALDADDSSDDLFSDTDDDDLFADIDDAAEGDSEDTVEEALDELNADDDDDPFGDADDDLFADLNDSDEESDSTAEETLDELEANDGEDDLFADADDLFSGEESTEDGGDIDSSLDDLDEDLDFDDDDDQLLEEEDAEEETPAADLGDLLEEETSDTSDDDLGLDNLFDEEASDIEDSLFDDPFEEAIAEDDTEASYDESLSAFEAAGDTEISQGDSAKSGDDAESGFTSDDNEFSFDDQSEPDFDISMDDDVADLLLDTGDEGDDEDDLTEEELPPEIDFGSTEDLGEFIDVSIMKKKMSSSVPSTESPMASPFDLGDHNALGDSGDDDISLGELFESNDEEDFDFDALDDGGDDPLDAVTGDEDEVSADIWELE